jgi:hypothetical protein
LAPSVGIATTGFCYPGEILRVRHQQLSVRHQLLHLPAGQIFFLRVISKHQIPSGRFVNKFAAATDCLEEYVARVNCEKRIACTRSKGDKQISSREG